ncbi:serine/threonine-protein kinase [Leptolyngbya sp. GGD]|uniref:serine/threonine-protein kinase n=1 Tax=Leptolyngbya sp. GGD TaxID=2997907 RepID=UPI00227B2931|nr:serine/threonine-protein kinase [Leptolyngbya sp. GGD]MCY6492408.1 serine/threonine-protein kinase [Leptolyngbya sp. GGD]
MSRADVLRLQEVKRSNYRILGLIGRGQFGRVHCAMHRQTGKLVALKALDLTGSPTSQFLRELKFLVTLEHPNIVACEAIEHWQGKRCLVMEYCEGGTLRQLMENHHRLDPVLSVKLVCDVLAGLEHASLQGIVHCDIKPENILLSVDASGWSAKISDFGISRLSHDLTREPANLTGSPAYMAPERFYGQYSHSTDLYAVGVLLYELLVGYRPFSGAPPDLMVAHLNQPVNIPAHIPTRLQTVILTALQKLKARRYQSATQMLEAMQGAIQDRSQPQFAPHNFATAIAAPKFTLQTLRQEALLDRVDQLSVIEVLPECDRDLCESSLIFYSQDQAISARSYAKGFFDRRAGKIRRNDAIAEPIQDLIVRSSGCFAVTERSIYRLSDTTAQRVAQFNHPSRIAIDPSGKWMAVATLNQSRAKFFSIWTLPQAQLACRPALCEPRSGEFIAIAALHTRHIALVSRKLVSRELGSTRFDFFNRHGKAFGTFSIPLQIERVFPTRKAHFLIAIETGFERSLVLLHLKPYRVIRVGILITPKFVTAYPWGIVVCDDHHLIALDYNGQQIGQAELPAGICAIAAHGETGLAIATWNAGQSTLYTLNLEVIRSASL